SPPVDLVEHAPGPLDDLPSQRSITGPWQLDLALRVDDEDARVLDERGSAALPGAHELQRIELRAAHAALPYPGVPSVAGRFDGTRGGHGFPNRSGLRCGEREALVVTEEPRWSRPRGAHEDCREDRGARRDGESRSNGSIHGDTSMRAERRLIARKRCRSP